MLPHSTLLLKNSLVASLLDRSPLIELQGDVTVQLNLNHGISTDGDHDILVIFLPTAFGQDECRWDGMALVRGEVNQVRTRSRESVVAGR